MKKYSFINSKIKPKNEAEKKACFDIVLSASKRTIKSSRELHRAKNKACEKYNVRTMTNPMLLDTYKKLIKSKRIKKNNTLFELLRKRKIRTSSGIASVAVFTKPYKCPGKCLFCPTQEDIPKSYIDNEPAVMRAILADYDPIRQINIRLRGLELAGNPADKIELIVMGGTWSYLPTTYQLKFILGCFAACNRYSSKLQITNNKLQINSKYQINKLPNNIKKLKELLKQEQKKNERTKYRIIGLTLETRSDYINQKEIKFMRELGCTRVEIGIQSLYDRILKINNRGHSVIDSVKATKLLKDAGFKVCYHMMPNLYGSSYKKDIEMFKKLFSDPRFKPDMLKIYPCVVTKFSPYLKLYKNKKYIPYTNEELIKLIIEIKKIIPEYVRIQRLIRDIPSQNIIGSSKVSNLRQIIQNSNKQQVTGNKNNKPLCRCIRCREIRGKKKKQVYLKRIDYQASDGREIFLQYIDKDNRVYALLRLRIPSQLFHLRGYNTSEVKSADTSEVEKYWISELQDCSIVREVHTYGPMVPVGTYIKKDPQHSGLGRRLIKKAEKITKKEFGFKKIAVISGVGVREYYRKLGYKKDGLYMSKGL